MDDGRRGPGERGREGDGMSSFYTRFTFTLGGRQEGRGAGRQRRAGGLTQANTQWDCRMDMAIARLVVVVGKWGEANGGETDRRAEQEDETG